jgi:hypothetical protein
LKRIILTALVFLSGVQPGQALTILDGDFVDWSFDATGTATVSREDADGNPGARLDVTTVSGAIVYGTAVKNDFTTAAALEGAAFTLSLDALSGAGAFAEGQLIVLLVEQAGSIYGRHLATTGFPRNFDTLEFPGVFEAAAFTRLLGAGAPTPDFGGGVPTRFGFAGANESSNTLTQYYDNFALEVPEPGGLAGQGAAVVVLGWIRGRARARA